MLSPEGAAGPVVIDIGSSTLRAGFAGSDRPEILEPAVVGLEASEYGFPMKFNKPAIGIETKRAWKKSESTTSMDFSDEECLSTLIQYSMSGLIGSSGGENMSDSDNPVLISEPSLQNNAYRQKVVQVLFEKMGCRGAFVCKRSVLSAFSLGKITALVVSVGAGVSNVSCIVGGHSNAHLSTNWTVAGDSIDQEIQARLKAQNPNINFLPKSFENVKTTKSFRESAERFHVRNLKEEICRVSENRDLRVSVVGSQPYELPDGTLVDCSKVAQSVPELLFDTTNRSLTSMVSDVIDKCKTSDESLAQSILSSVVVCGGTSAMTGFTERVQNELSHGYKNFAPLVKCHSGPSVADKQNSAWIGGSIVASLGNFSSLWITKREYEEHGVGIVGKKCP